MDPGGRKQMLTIRARECEGLPRPLDTRAGDDHLYDARSARARDDQLAVCIKTVVTKIDADVDQGRRGSRWRHGLE